MKSDRGMNDCEKRFTVQERVQLVYHINLRKGPPSHSCYLLPAHYSEALSLGRLPKLI